MKNFIDEVNGDVWGKAYLIVTKKLDKPFIRPRSFMTKIRHRTIIQALFPMHPEITFNATLVDGKIPLLTEAELKTAAQKMPKKQQRVRELVEARPDALLGVYNT